jgi:hypothetical protein
MKGTCFVTFIIGAAVGSAASYFIFKKKFQKDADAQIAAVKSKMAEIQESSDILKDAKAKAEANHNKSFDDISKDPEEKPDDYTDYSAISSKNKPMKNNKKISDDGIRSIIEHDYYNYINNKNFAEKIFTFYQGDSSLVDEETGVIVPDADTYVGANGVDAMNKSLVEEMYFVDEKKKTINCVSISEDSYYGNEE